MPTPKSGHRGYRRNSNRSLLLRSGCHSQAHLPDYHSQFLQRACHSRLLHPACCLRFVQKDYRSQLLQQASRSLSTLQGSCSHSNCPRPLSLLRNSKPTTPHHFHPPACNSRSRKRCPFQGRCHSPHHRLPLRCNSRCRLLHPKCQRQILRSACHSLLLQSGCHSHPHLPNYLLRFQIPRCRYRPLHPACWFRLVRKYYRSLPLQQASRSLSTLLRLCYHSNCPRPASRNPRLESTTPHYSRRPACS